MKRASPVLLIIALLVAGGWLWLRSSKHEEAKTPEPKASEPESRVTHDEQGRAVVKLDSKTQENAGLRFAKLTSAQRRPEMRAYGYVLDPAGLCALVNEVASARAVAIASSNELARLQTLVGQGNASESKRQTAEVTAIRDRLALQAILDRMVLGWGQALAGRTDLPELVQELTAQKAALARIDLPAGQPLSASPTAARLVTLAGAWATADFLGTIPRVDPTTLGQEIVLLIRPKQPGLVAGQAVTGYLELPGQSVGGWVVPDEAVIRSQGKGWAYLRDKGGESFTRVEVALDAPVEKGWWVREGFSDQDELVVTGAQSLLSEELKGALQLD